MTKNVHSNFIHNDKELEAVQILTKERTEKSALFREGNLCSSRTKSSIDTWNITDQSQRW